MRHPEFITKITYKVTNITVKLKAAVFLYSSLKGNSFVKGCKSLEHT